MTSTRTTARLAAIGAAAALAAVALPGSASAHVSVTADTTAAGSYAVLTLAVPHGCDGSPTTRVAVRVPAGIESVTPTVNPGWTVAKRTEELAAPVTTAHGKVLTERVSEVVWTARTPLAEGYRDTLSLQVSLPEDAAGRTLVFPTVQTCTEGETGWTQVPAAGQDADALEHPAPSVTVTDAAAHGHGHDAAAAPAEEAEAAEGAVATATVPAGSTTGAADLGGLVLGALGLAAGLTALVRGRSARTRPDQA
ncbi:Uncharacterized protein YcnI [Friedmanniella luteola]|uniref:Uncharacterized protein YcnI n=1 Tax=Friedmanniella luteola TaxID=546871 RepID=A0A1H2ACB0_9ACTN|nr:YcnI family protein [Friedmanniella luteola]SDT43524.1 Uncharacterized protein YcnI [Friedmanniella luteola]